MAYFCAEYGFHESFPIYSGGLGVLAGDYCKAASDERANFVAVGLLYEQGYFTQTVDNDGMQHAEYRERDPRDLPVEPARNAQGEWLKVSVRIAGRDVVARLWKAQVGRVPVYLLDTNCAENAPSDRDITHRLYGGDESTRVRQEMILGIGGVRALRALGVAPAVWHLNEGHAAFLILELLREHLARRPAVRRGTGGGGRRLRVHHAHAGGRRARRLRPRPDRRSTSATSSASWASPVGALPRAGARALRAAACST